MLEAAKAGLEKLHDRIKELEAENAELKEPKLCETCEAKNTCIVIAALKKYGIWKDTDEFGCNYHEPKAP